MPGIDEEGDRLCLCFQEARIQGKRHKNEHPSTDMVSREPSLRVMWEVKRKLTAGSEGKCQIGSSERLFKKKVQTLFHRRIDQK